MWTVLVEFKAITYALDACYFNIFGNNIDGGWYLEHIFIYNLVYYCHDGSSQFFWTIIATFSSTCQIFILIYTISQNGSQKHPWHAGIGCIILIVIIEG